MGEQQGLFPTVSLLLSSPGKSGLGWSCTANGTIWQPLPTQNSCCLSLEEVPLELSASQKLSRAGCVPRPLAEGGKLLICV